ncbi:leucine-rich repeat protein [Bacteroidales bacterium OttesenSCG-928-C19]|nr:leucine-rich repeat protein [Bacteroidales bacterium OttesenSCG-928-C19]
MKKLLFSSIITLFMVNGLFSQTNKTLHITEAGTLHTLFSEEEKTTIDSLVLTGLLDARDFRFLRDSLTALTVLDVRDINIVEYVGTEGTLYGENYTYPSNTFPAFAFYRSYVMQKLAYERLTFIPDGGLIGGVCYQTSLTATAFENATIQSKEDILSVGMKIEHSALSDLIFQLRCPSGKSVYLKKMTWNNPDSLYISFSRHKYMLGIPNRNDRYWDYDNPETNPPGIPWLYSWSENKDYTETEYRGVMDTNDLQPSYRLDTVVWEGYDTIFNKVLSPSDYENRSGFFQPTESFDSLIGCPINGEWSLIICDEFRIDNGWISEWYIDLRHKNSGKELPSKTNSLFESKTSLTSVYLPTSIETIGEYAFYGCTGLENITISSPNPPTVENEAFAKIENISLVNLHIPEEFAPDYETANVWEDFFIVEIKSTDINKIKNTDVRVYPNPTTGKIEIEALSLPNDIKVFNIIGELIIDIKNQSSIDLSSYPNGIYFIQIDNSTYKIIKQSK